MATGQSMDDRVSAVSGSARSVRRQINPSTFWHHDVGEDQVRPTLADRGQGLRAVRDRCT
jgi:hypothetical protein